MDSKETDQKKDLNKLQDESVIVKDEAEAKPASQDVLKQRMA